MSISNGQGDERCDFLNCLQLAAGGSVADFRNLEHENYVWFGYYLNRMQNEPQEKIELG